MMMMMMIAPSSSTRSRSPTDEASIVRISWLAKKYFYCTLAILYIERRMNALLRLPCEEDGNNKGL
jgi:hypothetical protein